jgi:hypothetical protein
MRQRGEDVTVSWRAAAAALDAGAALFAAVNTAYFIARLSGSSEESPSRRLAIITLLIISLGALLEAIVLLASLSAGEEAPLLSSSQWFVVRFLACTGSGGVCALVLQRMAGGG